MSGISKVMILDLDAHQVCLCVYLSFHLFIIVSFIVVCMYQGNGHERDFMSDDRVFIMDMYNRWIYPNDTRAKGNNYTCT